jgi:hypothetical protein
MATLLDISAETARHRGFSRSSLATTTAHLRRFASRARQQAWRGACKRTADDVVREVERLAFSNKLDYVTPAGDGAVEVDLRALNRDQGAAIQEVTVEQFMNGKSDNARPVRRIKFKLHDKKAPLLLGRGSTPSRAAWSTAALAAGPSKQKPTRREMDSRQTRPRHQSELMAASPTQICPIVSQRLSPLSQCWWPEREIHGLPRPSVRLPCDPAAGSAAWTDKRFVLTEPLQGQGTCELGGPVGPALPSSLRHQCRRPSLFIAGPRRA